MGPKLLTSPGDADMHAFLMNPWNALPESYEQRVYKNTLATVNCRIQQAQNPMPAVVICTEPVPVHNAILLDYLTSKVALEKPDIGNTDPTIPMDNNYTADELHFVMPGGSGDSEVEGDEVDERDEIPTASGR